MNINLNKSKITGFRSGCLRTYERWTFRGNAIEVVSFHKYLGTIIAHGLFWNKTKEALAYQASKAVLNIVTE